MALPPFDTVYEIISAANVRLNGKLETLQAIGGNVLGNTNAFYPQSCYQLQNRQ